MTDTPKLENISFGKIKSYIKRFKEMNTDGNGYLDFNELKNALGEKRAKSWLRNIDVVDGNGNVDLGAFAGFFISRETN